MKMNIRSATALAALVLAISTGGASAQSTLPVETANPDGSLAQRLELTHGQRSAILKAVGEDKSKVANTAPNTQVPTTVGAAVPPSINLSPLPDEAVSDNAAAKLYQFTVVHGDVVIVDPTRMQVVEVIRKLSE